MDKRKCIIIIISIFLTIFFIIGITTYLTGCHDILQPNCLRFWKTEGKVIDHYTVLRTCTVCVAYIYLRKSTICTRYNTYDCYDSYVTFEFNILTKRNCNLYITNDKSQNNSLIEAKNKYALSNFYTIYIDKSSYECSSENNITIIAIVGFVFLLLTALILIALIIAIFKYRLWKKKDLNRDSNKNNINEIDGKNLAVQSNNQFNDDNFGTPENVIELDLGIPIEIKNNKLNIDNNKIDELENNSIKNKYSICEPKLEEKELKDIHKLEINQYESNINIINQTGFKEKEKMEITEKKIADNSSLNMKDAPIAENEEKFYSNNKI